MALRDLQALTGSSHVSQGSQPEKPSNPFGDPQKANTQKRGKGLFSSMFDAVSDVGQTIGNVGIGMAKSIVKLPQEAAEFGADIGTRAAAAIRPDVTYDQLKEAQKGSAMEKATERPEWTKAHGTAQKVGEVIGDVAQFAVPVGGEAKMAGLAEKAGGLLEKAPEAAEAVKTVGNLAKKSPFITEKLLPFVQKSIGEGAEQFMRTGIQTGDTKDAMTGAAMGVATPSINAGFKAAGNVGRQVIETISSKLSGVPKEAIDYAISHPDGVRNAIREMAKDGELGAQKVLDNAQEAFDAMKESRRAAYRANLEKVEQETMQMKNGQWYVKRDITPKDVGEIPSLAGKEGQQWWVPTDFSVKGVKDTITRTLKDFGADIKGKVADLEKVPLPKGYKNDLQEVIDKVYNWDDISPKGLDDLRENLGVFRKGGKATSLLSSADKKFNKIVDDIYHNVSSYVGDRVPQIREMNKAYAAASEPIERIAQELRLEQNPVTAMRKLQNVFNPKSNVYRDLVTQLGEKGSRDLLSDISGLLMSKWTPEGLGSYVSTVLSGQAGLSAITQNPFALLMLPPTLAASSPRIVGGVATGLGKAAEKIEPLVPVLRSLEKGAVSEAAR